MSEQINILRIQRLGSRGTLFISLLVITSLIAGCTDDGAMQKNVSKSSSALDNSTTLADLQAQIKDSPPATENQKPKKLSPAAEQAINDGMVEIKDPAVQACTDQRIAAIRKERGDPESAIAFDVYNEAAVACGFNM